MSTSGGVIGSSDYFFKEMDELNPTENVFDDTNDALTGCSYPPLQPMPSCVLGGLNNSDGSLTPIRRFL